MYSLYPVKFDINPIMALLEEIVKFCDEELEISSFVDTSLNGLQIEGNSQVTSIAVSVDCGLSIIEQARVLSTQMLFVHHGLFWRSPIAITASHKKIVETALAGGISIYAAHLPLDAHLKYGNNACLARLLNLTALRPFAEVDGKKIGLIGVNSKTLNISELSKELKKLPGTSEYFRTLPFGPEIPKNIAVVSGSGAFALEAFHSAGFDTLVTGEAKQFAYHFAKDNGLNVIFAGHYATETVGVKEMPTALETQFGVTSHFIDCPTGI